MYQQRDKEAAPVLERMRPQRRQPTWTYDPRLQCRSSLIQQLRQPQTGDWALTPPSFARKIVAELLSVDPMMPLKRGERALLRDYLVTTFEEAHKERHEILRALAKRESSLQLLKRLEDPSRWRAELEVRLEGGSSYQGANLIGWRSEEGYGARLDDELDRLVRKVPSKRQVNFFELGAGDYQAAEGIKRRYGDRMDVWGSSLERVPTPGIDHPSVLTGELIPKSFAGRYDIVVSRGTVHFSPMPDLVLLNLGRCLAPGGRAYIEIEALTTPMIARPEFSSRILRHFGWSDLDARQGSSSGGLGEKFYQSVWARLDSSLATLAAKHQVRTHFCSWQWQEIPKAKSSIPAFLVMEREQ